MPRPVPPTVADLSAVAASRLIEVLDLADQNVLTASHPALTAFGEAVARYVRARGSQWPGRSAASWIREQLKQLRRADVTLPATVGDRPLIKALCAAAADSLPRVASTLPADHRGADEPEVADMLGVSLGQLREMLCTIEGRQALWYPLHVGGGRFRWMRPWLSDPDVQTKRAREPEPPHPVPLPDGYEGIA